MSGVPTAVDDGEQAEQPPLRPWRESVQPEWIDYNGHLTEACYVLVFGHATDQVMAQAGMTRTYIESTCTSLFTVEAHLRYLGEVQGLVELEVRSGVIGRTAKLVRLWHEMWLEGRLRATEEVLMSHVDTVAGRSSPMPDELAAGFDRFLLPPPAAAGRAITVGPSPRPRE